jgi:tRNA modification GTPase
MNNAETICALSTARGVGAIALIRLSGSQALGIAERIFSKKLSQITHNGISHGWIMDGDERVDDAVLTVFRAPRSYTGEDIVEIACHGSLYIQQRILHLLMTNGARLAGPGEYTMRAFMNGKLDLSQAEAVGDLIASESAAAHKQALHQMRGGFSREINALRERLIHFAALMELELDFAEEDVEFAQRDQLKMLLEEILAVVTRLADSFQLGNVLKNGVSVAIIGAPNAGKSTLLNALLNEERAIVSEIPGTTRDTIEEYLTLGGIRFHFIDTAGIRETGDRIENIGISRAIEKARTAHIILYIFDAAVVDYEHYLQFLNYLRKAMGEEKLILSLANKVDSRHFDEMVFEKQFSQCNPLFLISAELGEGLDELKATLVATVDKGRIDSGETIVTNARHYHALCAARLALDDVLNGLQAGLTGDLLSIDIRNALQSLGDITGAVTPDDLLNHIFSSFCIGK